MAEESENVQEKNTAVEKEASDNGTLQLGAVSILTIIGEIEGHDCLGNGVKTTKYDHVLPVLAELEERSEVGGIIVLINTAGGDVEAGLAIAEMLCSMTKPTVSLVLGGSHSIGVPIAVSCKKSFIVPTGTMVIHPVRLSGVVIGAAQTYEYFKVIQDRVTGFICSHSHIKAGKLEKMMMNTDTFAKDIGTILVGKEAVECGLIDEVGGIDAAMNALHKMMEDNMNGSGR